MELNADLRFTSSGLLAMANNGVDGNSSEFFITGPDDLATDPSSGQPASNFSDGFLDFRYTIFGKLIAGDNVRQALAATQVGPNSSGEDSEPFDGAADRVDEHRHRAGRRRVPAQGRVDAPRALTRSPSTDGLGGSQTFIGQRRRHESLRSAEPLGGADQRHRHDHHCRQYGGEIHPGGRVRQ